MASLFLAHNLKLPVEAVTETFAFLAKRGAGKTYAAKVLAEEMLGAGAQVVVLTPLDVWWGLRSSADGTSGGFPIAVFGGRHGDIPLEPPGGQLVARLAVEQALSMVLTLDGWSKNDQRRFATDFLETLFQHNTEPMHLILEEADRWAPQRPMKGEERLLGASEEIVRRGRSKGIGCTLVTQRSAVLHKDVLTQTEILVAMRTPAKHDRNAIDAWFDAHDAGDVDPNQAMAELPSLVTGEAWVSSPYWFPSVGVPGLVKVRFREASTFDSSATPTLGQRTRVARTFADVDLAAIKEEMAATIERAKADDPKELRRQIADLRKQLSARPAEKVVETVTERVEVPVIPDDLAKDLRAELAKIRELLEDRRALLTALERFGNVGPRQPVSAKPTSERAITPESRPVAARPRAEQPAPPPPGDGSVSGPQQRILDSLAWFASVGIDPVDRTQLSLYAGASPRSSAYGNNLGALRTAGLVDYPVKGTVALTTAGAAMATPADDIRSSEELQAALFSKLPGPQVRILQVLIDAYPDDVDRTELAEAAGASPTSSTYGNHLGALRTLGLIDYPTRGRVVARPVMFLM